MPAIQLTDQFIKNVPLPEKGRDEYADTLMPRLFLRVSANGVKSWSYTYDIKEHRYRSGLGQYPGVSLRMARDRARDVMLAVQRGENPVEDKRAEERELKENGFTACKNEFMEKYAKVETKERTWKDTLSLFDRFAVPRFGDRPVKEIRRRDIIALVEDVAKETPFQANHLRVHLSTMFNWLMLREVVEVNPVTGIPPPVDLTPRERTLTDTEIVALWRATAKMVGVHGQLVRFLLLTGVRLREGSCLRWDELDGDWALMPGSRMKNGRDFKAPLSGWAKAIVESMPKTGPYVFSADGSKPFSNMSKAKERLDRLMAVELGLPEGESIKPWRIHDLRRTMATGVAMLKIHNEVIDRLLAHVPQRSDVTRFVYNRYMYDDEAMEAVQKWAAHIGKLTSGLKVVTVSK